MSDERALRAALEKAQGRVKALEAQVAELEASLDDALDANAEFAETEVLLRQRIGELERPAPGEGREVATLKARVHGMDLAHRALVSRTEALQREREQWVTMLEELGHRELLTKLQQGWAPPLPTRQELLAELEALRTKVAALERRSQ